VRERLEWLVAYALAFTSAASASLYGFLSAAGPYGVVKAAGLFGVAFVGCHGPAWVSKLKQRLGWLGALFATAATAICVSATLWGGLGSNATGAATLSAERGKIAASVHTDRAELARLTNERSAMVFVPATAEAVAAAREAVAAAGRVRAAECEDRGSRCRQRETEEAGKREALATVLANRALTEKAAGLDAAIAAVRARLDRAAPAVEIDPQASTFSQLTGITVATSAALNAFWLPLAFEIGAMLAMLIAYSNTAPAATSVPRTRTIEGVPLGASKNVVPMVLRQPKPAVIIGRHMLARLARGEGELALTTIYGDLCSWCGERSLNPPTVAEFGREFAEVCSRHDIATRTEGKAIYAIGLQLKTAA
jgi:hypothetical protein